MNATEERDYIVNGLRELSEWLSRPPPPNPERTAKRDQDTIMTTEEMKYRDYEAAGIEPKFTGDKMLVSLTLARLLLGDSAHG
jgi:hypothetical protein